ncbi:MAG: hypothetical protein OXL34_08075 [Gemmatimonadota bacterium]|nr:hypothetical protein [Gemmatimonadota bacterium]
MAEGNRGTGRQRSGGGLYSLRVDDGIGPVSAVKRTPLRFLDGRAQQQALPLRLELAGGFFRQRKERG